MKLLFVCQVSTEGTVSRCQTGHSDNGRKCADFTCSSANGSPSIFGRQFACPQCQCLYVTKSGLKQHVDVMHKKLYRYVCETCRQGFMVRSQYYDHMSAHAGLKRHMCTMCEMKFTSKRTLNKHVYHFHPNEAANILYNYYK